MLPKIDRNASTAEQIEQAAKFAGVSPAILDGMWRTESARGTHKTMVGPDTKWGTAKGHFQHLDHIRETLSKRAGKEFDPFDFNDSLTMATMMLKENMDKFGNEDDAIRAYFGGWDKKNWGNGTEDYLTKVKGGAPAQATAAQATPAKASKDFLTAQQTWDGATPQPGVQDVPELDMGGLLRQPTTEPYQAWIKEHTKARTEEQRVVNDRPFWGTEQDTIVGAAIQKTLNPTWTTLAKFNGMEGDFDYDPIFRAAINADWQRTVQGFTQPHEHAYLLNSISPADLERRKFFLQEQRQNDKVLQESGTWTGLAAGFIAGGADPMTYVTGFGAMKAMAMTGRGAFALAQAGRTVAAGASAVAENVAGNISYEVLRQVMGEHKTADDYALAAVTGLIPAALAIPGINRTAKDEALLRVQKQFQDNLKKQQEDWQKVMTDLGPDATPDQIKAEFDRRQADKLKKDADRLVTPKDFDNDVVVPDPNRFLDEDVPPHVEPTRVDTDNVEPPKVEPAKADPENAQPPVSPDDEFKDVTLTDDLRKSSPRYGEHALEFESDLDKAAYIVANAKNKSAAESKFLDWANDNGISPEALRAHGAKVKEAIKAMAKTGDTLQVPKVEVKVKLAWRDNALKSKHSLGEFLDGIIKRDPDSLLAKAAALIKDAPGVMDAVTVLDPKARSNVKSRGLVTLGRGRHENPYTVVHEAVHVATIHRIDTYMRNPDLLAPRDRTAVQNLEKLYKHLEVSYKKETGKRTGVDSSDHVQYAFRNFHEFAAQALSSKEFQLWMSTQPAPGFVKATPKRNAWRSFLKTMKDVLGIKSSTSSLDEVMSALEALVMQKDTTLLDKAGNVVAWAKGKLPERLGTDPISMKYGLNLLPEHSPLERANKKAIIKLYHDAVEWANKNPRSAAGVDTIMDNKYLNMALPATLIAKSDNPVARWVSAKLLEQSMGAHGRMANAAIAKAVRMQSYIGTFINDFDLNYSMWRNQKAGVVRGSISDVFDQKLQREFNRAVFVEIETRGLYPDRVTSDPHIKAAADSYEKHMEVMRLEQVNNKTPGFAGLPNSSIGYVTHLLDADRVRALGTPALNAMHKALKDQFMNGLEGMDEAFADKVASIYLRNALDRSAGISNIPMEVRNMHASEFVKDAMKKAGMTDEEIFKLTKRLSYGAASHTKARLKIDTLKQYTAEDGSTFQLADLYRQDMRDILRGYASRVSGEVGLMQNGVAGSGGLHLVRQALAADPAFKEHDAVSQVFSELLGRPVNAQAENLFLNGVTEYTSLTNMGWMGFMQFGEYIHAAVTLGVGNAAKSIGAIPRLRAEVKAILRGEKVNNGILDSIEQYGGGGEFGTDGYRMISGYDTTARHEDFTSKQSSGPVLRLLHRAGYGLGTVTLHRAIHSVQRRGIAEQVVLRALRELKEGNLTLTMKNMGFDDRLASLIADDLNHATVWNGNKVKSFDITQFRSDEAREAFLQSVHRGVSQVIQSAFIGERGWWTHTNLGRFATQFRNYPLLSMEKQWGRVNAMHGGGLGGVAAAMGMVVSAAGLALPVYAARVAVNAAGREDQDEYLDRMFSPDAVAKNIMNYIALTGMMQDFLQLLTTTAGAINEDFQMWVPEQGRGGSTNRTTISGLIPGLASMDKVLALPGQLNDPHKLVRALPYSNLPWLTPMVNALRGD